MKTFDIFFKESSIINKQGIVIQEAVSIQNMGRVSDLIISYFSRNLKTNLVKMPGGEEYFNSTGAGFGLRFFMERDLNKFDSIRFNWAKKRINSAAVDSVDLFSKGKNVYNITFDTNTSLVKVLPFLLDFIKNPKMGTVSYITKDNTLSEQRITGNPILAINDYLVKNRITKPMMKSDLKTIIVNNFPSLDPWLSAKIYTALKTVKPGAMLKDGPRNYMDIGGGKLAPIADKLYDAIFTKAKVTTGSPKETYESPPEVAKLEAKGLDRLTFETQLDDMRESVRMLYRGITNAVFIGGRGGIGKTFNVEQVLSELGLKDGAGYFKNAGSISAAGLYRMLFQHRNGLILFDDSDSVFGDQEARNILKAATDTKKVRKIAWSKRSSDIVHADDYTDEMEDDGLFPSFFEFTGKILFISNLKMDKLDPDGALRTRGILIDISPTDEEVYNLMEKLVGKFSIAEGLELSMAERREVVQLLRDNPRKEPNFRILDRALNMRAGATPGFDWKKFVIYYA